MMDEEKGMIPGLEPEREAAGRRFLLAAVNAKYIHSNPAIYSLKVYAGQELQEYVELAEYTINQPMQDILTDIYMRKPDVVGFSCYIWNRRLIGELAAELPKLLPETDIWLGGPEASCNGKELLERYPKLTGIMTGEGEATFRELLKHYLNKWENTQVSQKQISESDDDLRGISGLLLRSGPTPSRPLLDLSGLPFLYENMAPFENKIIYYESSRGCPYRCSYCLSSLDKMVRLKDTSAVKRELQAFLDQGVKQVKFTDRTFNCCHDHAMEIWKYIVEHDNGVTNFHFEISADILSEEEIRLLSLSRPGLIQLEIGVQSMNLETLKAVRRFTDLDKLEKNVAALGRGGNVHRHLDLIAGLPYEDYESFRNSFDRVYRMKPEQLQLGFLKVLKGSFMAENAGAYDLCFHGEPPYEVLSTRWLDYGDLVKLKTVETMVEAYYNSSQFVHTLKEMGRHWKSPYAMFQELGDYYGVRRLHGLSHSRLARYEILYDFLKETDPCRIEIYQDLLMYDLYLRENIKSRPAFAPDQSRFKGAVREFFINEGKNPAFLKGYEAYDARQMSKMAHIEVMSDKRMVLFDYKNRNPLNHNAKAVTIGIWQEVAEKGENRSCING